MGQPTATQLVRHGVAAEPPGRIRLVDGDIVSARNLIGTEYRQGHIGMAKVQAAGQIVQEINPEANVSCWNRMLTRADIPAVTEMAGRSDLLVLAADSFELMLEIARTCYSICPQVMAVFGPRADYAEVAFSLPRATCPIPAVMGKRKRQAISNPQALGCDTAYVCSFLAALCLRLLLGDARGNELLDCYANAPLFVLGLRRSWIFSDLPQDTARTIVCVHVEPSGKEKKK